MSWLTQLLPFVSSGDCFSHPRSQEILKLDCLSVEQITLIRDFERMEREGRVFNKGEVPTPPKTIKKISNMAAPQAKTTKLTNRKSSPTKKMNQRKGNSSDFTGSEIGNQEDIDADAILTEAMLAHSNPLFTSPQDDEYMERVTGDLQEDSVSGLSTEQYINAAQDWTRTLSATRHLIKVLGSYQNLLALYNFVHTTEPVEIDMLNSLYKVKV